VPVASRQMIRAEDPSVPSKKTKKKECLHVFLLPATTGHVVEAYDRAGSGA